MRQIGHAPLKAVKKLILRIADIAEYVWFSSPQAKYMNELDREHIHPLNAPIVRHHPAFEYTGP